MDEHDERQRAVVGAVAREREQALDLEVVERLPAVAAPLAAASSCGATSAFRLVSARRPPPSKSTTSGASVALSYEAAIREPSALAETRGAKREPITASPAASSS